MTITDWVAVQRPEVPAPFLGFLASDASPTVDGLLNAARDALKGSLEAKEQDRAGAFTLLAADAFVTFACLALVEDDRGPDALQRLAEELVREFS